MQNKFPGVSAQLAAVRHYPQPLGAQASTILGYTAPISATQLKALPAKKQEIERNTTVGVTGLEQQYEKYLHGKPGIKEVTVDHVGAQTGRIKNTQPRQGDDIVTNLDAKAQATLEQQVNNAITTARGSGYTADYAAGVVLNSRTGGIVAMASEPTYNPAHPPPTLTKTRYHHLQYGGSSNPFIDKAYGSANPPGSTFKPISASGLLADGTMSTGGAYNCPTNFQGRHNFDSGNGRGFISLHEALVVSCDTYFFSLGYTDWVRDNNLIKAGKKPREGVQHMARAYGYGENPHVDLPSASYGHIADRTNTKLFWQNNRSNYCKGAARRAKGTYLQQIDQEFCQTGYIFQPGDQENEDVGQGTVLASPLQVATAYAAIANGGKVFEPRVAKAIVSPTGKLIKRIKAPVRDHLPISQAGSDLHPRCLVRRDVGVIGYRKVRVRRLPAEQGAGRRQDRYRGAERHQPERVVVRVLRRADRAEAAVRDGDRGRQVQPGCDQRGSVRPEHVELACTASARSRSSRTGYRRRACRRSGQRGSRRRPRLRRGRTAWHVSRPTTTRRPAPAARRRRPRRQLRPRRRRPLPVCRRRSWTDAARCPGDRLVGERTLVPDRSPAAGVARLACARPGRLPPPARLDARRRRRGAVRHGLRAGLGRDEAARGWARRT